jgi:hypothetical protein
MPAIGIACILKLVLPNFLAMRPNSGHGAVQAHEAAHAVDAARSTGNFCLAPAARQALQDTNCTLKKLAQPVKPTRHRAAKPLRRVPARRTNVRDMAFPLVLQFNDVLLNLSHPYSAQRKNPVWPAGKFTRKIFLKCIHYFQ